MCTCVWPCTCTDVCACLHLCAWVCTCVRLCVPVCVRVCTDTCMSSCVCMCVHMREMVCTCVWQCTCADVCACLHVCTCVCICARLCVCVLGVTVWSVHVKDNTKCVWAPGQIHELLVSQCLPLSPGPPPQSQPVSSWHHEENKEHGARPPHLASWRGLFGL